MQTIPTSQTPRVAVAFLLGRSKPIATRHKLHEDRPNDMKRDAQENDVNGVVPVQGARPPWDQTQLTQLLSLIAQELLI